MRAGPQPHALDLAGARQPQRCALGSACTSLGGSVGPQALCLDYRQPYLDYRQPATYPACPAKPRGTTRSERPLQRQFVRSLFGGWSQHYSLYPSSDHVVVAFRDELAPYEIGKGTIRFPLSEPVPVRLIEGIAKLRAKEVVEREKGKAAAPKKR